MAITQLPIDATDPEVKNTGSDGKHVSDFVKPSGLWTLGDFETDFPASLLKGRIAAIVRQPGESPLVEPPEPPEPAFPGDPEAIVEVNNAWEVDVRWELTGRLQCFLSGFWRVRLNLESQGDDALDRQSNYPIDILYDGRSDTYHAQFKIRPNFLPVESDEGTPFKPNVAVIFMTRCGPDQRSVPGPIIGRVVLPTIQCFNEVIPSPIQ